MNDLKSDIEQKSREKENREPPLYIRYGFLSALVLISGLTFIAYSNTIHFPFLFDDNPYIVNNFLLHSLGNFWPPTGTRYLGFLSFALNYHFWELNVTAYRLTNIVIHVLNACLIYLLVSHTFRTPSITKSGLKDRELLAFALALTSSLIFALHPIQTQAVTYITQRFASLATVFYLSSLVLFIKWRTSVSRTGTAYYVLSIIFAVTLQKTKEIGFTLPFVIALYEFFFFEGGLKKRLLALTPFILCLAIIPISILGPEVGIGESGLKVGGHLREHQLRDLTTLSPYNYLITQFRVIVTYIRLLVLPVGQTLDYAYAPLNSIFSAQVLLSMLFLLVLFGLSIYLFIDYRRTGNVFALLISFAVLWFFITLSVESSIIPIKDVINEHRLYLPSIGMIVAFTSLIFYALHNARERRRLNISIPAFTLLLIIVLAVPLALASYKRNWVWKSKISLYEDIVKKNPENSRGHNNLGNSYYLEGRIGDAIREYRIAIKLGPVDSNPNYNLGNAYQDLGRLDEAIREYKRALEIDPKEGRAFYHLGNVYVRMGRIDEAVNEYKKALDLYPNYIMARLALGRAYQGKGLIDDAIKEFNTILKLEPGNLDARLSLGDAYQKAGRTEDAVEQYDIILIMNPGYVEAHLRLGDLFSVMGISDRAIHHYRQFVEKAPPEYNPQKAKVINLINKLTGRPGRTLR